MTHDSNSILDCRRPAVLSENLPQKCTPTSKPIRAPTRGVVQTAAWFSVTCEGDSITSPSTRAVAKVRSPKSRVAAIRAPTCENHPTGDAGTSTPRRRGRRRRGRLRNRRRQRRQKLDLNGDGEREARDDLAAFRSSRRQPALADPVPLSVGPSDPAAEADLLARDLHGHAPVGGGAKR